MSNFASLYGGQFTLSQLPQRCSATNLPYFRSKEPQQHGSSHEQDFLVYEETVVLRRWGSCTQEFGFIKGVDDVN